MMTPEQRYLNDNQFRHLVDYMENFIHQAQFTPSELRDAAMLGAIHYEMKTVRPRHFSLLELDAGARADHQGGTRP